MALAAPAGGREPPPLLRCRPAGAAPSLYDPHPAPADRPWLEGYYTRIVPRGWGGSLAVLAGTCVAPSGLPQPGYAALLVQRPGAVRLEVFEAFPAGSGFLLPDGPPRRAPDVRSPPAFRWSAPGVGWFGPAGLSLRLPGGAAIEASFTAPLSWTRRGPDHGPEGYLVRSPSLTQHWFVHSVASACRFSLSLPGAPPLEGEGLAHQEKNWGYDFPGAWVWAQGLRGRPGEPDFVQLALAGGDVDLRLGDDRERRERGWLLGVQVGEVVRTFRSPLASFEVISTPAVGSVRLLAEDAWTRVEVHLTAPPESFAPVAVPTARGFRPGAVESFRAQAQVELFERERRGRPLRKRASAALEGAALEFGRLDDGG